MENDTTLTPDPYVDATKLPKGRRLKPSTCDGIIQALRSGSRQKDIATAYGVSESAVCKIARARKPQLDRDIDSLAELAFLENEIEEHVPAGQARTDLIYLLRAGHLLRKMREANHASE